MPADSAKVLKARRWVYKTFQFAALVLLMLCTISLPFLLTSKGVEYGGLAGVAEINILLNVIIGSLALLLLWLARSVGQKMLWAWPCFWTLVAVNSLQNVTLMLRASF